MKPFGWVLFLSTPLTAQLTLEQAVDQALSRYPAVQASLEQVAAASAGINLARASYLPRADFLGQVNRSTHNNVFGMLLAQPVVSPISGPVLRTNSLDNVWGTAVGVLVSWEPFDFGLRKASVDAADRTRKRAEAQVDVTRLQVGAAAADAFLTTLAAQQTVVAAEAGVERARVLDRAVTALVRSELRPGVEASRTGAEVALAQTQRIRADQAVEEGRAALAQLLGVEAATIAIAPGGLLGMPPDGGGGASEAARHPLAIAQNAVVEEGVGRERVLDRSLFPRFALQGTTYARGTGVQPDGATGGAASGLGPNIQNWGLGMTVTFPALDGPSLRARREIEQARRRSETARYNQILQDVNGQIEKARVQVAGARRVAQHTPAQLAAARAVEQQAGARYQAGLGTIVEVAEAQRLLAQAEIDDSLARLSVWRAMLALAAARGDVNDFVRQAGRP
ncbi:MAG: TolC family protein [Bryobacteraceae bacterium]